MHITPSFFNYVEILHLQQKWFGRKMYVLFLLTTLIRKKSFWFMFSDVGGKVFVKCILEKQDEWYALDSSGSG
jgi:hypothetical protein